MRAKLGKDERGAALLEAAITVPMILLICVGIFEFGRAYQTAQVLTNAAREGARQAILSGRTDDDIRLVVERYMRDGGLPCVAGGKALPKDCSGTATVNISRTVELGPDTASKIEVSYPFNFMMLNPVVKLVVKDSKTGAGFDMKSVALMRNE